MSDCDMHACTFVCAGCVQSVQSNKALTEAFVHAATGDVDVLRQPLSSHADPNEANGIGGGTAIQAAIANGDEGCLEVLLANNANPNGSARLQHFSALQHAAFLASSVESDAWCFPRRLRVVEMLLCAGANPNQGGSNVDDFEPFATRCRSAHHNPLVTALALHSPSEVVRVLCTFGATPSGDLSARFAEHRGHPARRPAKATLMACLERTPFMIACAHQRPDLGTAALQTGATLCDPALHSVNDARSRRPKAVCNPNEKVRVCAPSCVRFCSCEGSCGLLMNVVCVCRHSGMHTPTASIGWRATSRRTPSWRHSFAAPGAHGAARRMPRSAQASGTQSAR